MKGQATLPQRRLVQNFWVGLPRIQPEPLCVLWMPAAAVTCGIGNGNAPLPAGGTHWRSELRAGGRVGGSLWAMRVTA
jgi:hypothetical protein